MENMIGSPIGRFSGRRPKRNCTHVVRLFDRCGTGLNRPAGGCKAALSPPFLPILLPTVSMFSPIVVRSLSGQLERLRTDGGTC